MLQGTGSDVGKTVLVAALCRVYTRRGLSVLPFKPQNMSNNAAVAGDGGEIGRAQWLQALACGVEPSVHMNPVLLKPESEHGAQVIVHGQMVGRAEAGYYRTHKQDLLNAVQSSFHTLKRQADLVLVEGAGSPAEVNLRAGDIANMGFAAPSQTPVVLVAVINRGGVIASIVGTHAVLPPEERGLIEGTIINQFRGDMSLFAGGLATIHEKTQWLNFGVVPFDRALKQLPAEDAVVLDRADKGPSLQKLIAVPLLPHIANFDDFDALRQEEVCDVVFCPPGQPLPRVADLIILPGSKSTLADLSFLKKEGWNIDILAHARAGKPVFGVCGGYQMLGQEVRDSEGIEGPAGVETGLGLLDVETTILSAKEVRNTVARCTTYDVPVHGYEIHLGETRLGDNADVFIENNGLPLGARSKTRKIAGAYIHRLFDDGAFRKAFMADFLGTLSNGTYHIANIERQLDAAADCLEAHLDIDGLLAAAR